MSNWNTTEAALGAEGASLPSDSMLSRFHHTESGLAPKKFALATIRPEVYVVQDEFADDMDDSCVTNWLSRVWLHLPDYSKVHPRLYFSMADDHSAYFLAPGHGPAADRLTAVILESRHLLVKSLAERWKAMRQEADTQVDPFLYSYEAFHKSYEEFLTSSASLSPVDCLRGKLEDLKKDVPRSHDSDMKVPTDKAFADAFDFISRLDLNAHTMPEIELIGDGEINFSWARDRDNLRVDLGFYGTGKYSCFARKDGHDPVYEDDVLASDGLSRDIRALLQE